MVAYIKSDLDFILAQIKIAEAHAGGQPLYGPGGLIPTYNLAWGLRTVDGTYNHLINPELGAADNEFPEGLGTQFRTIMVDPDGPGPAPLVPVSYTPGVDNDGPGTAGPSDVFDPYVRTISNLIVDQTLGNPSAILTALQRAGIVSPANQMAVTAQISAAYEPLAPLFKDVSDAEREYASASAAASASPGNAALQAAATAALVELEAARTALDAADDGLMTLLETNGVELEGANVKITNLAPDEGLSASFNSWFTLFGQFFDHGLDLVAKGGNGTVFIPLMPDDPLYVPGGDTNFMVLTRATLAGPGADGIMGTADDTDRPVNTTTAFVDQNQTYTSHPSHQVFLREYVFNADGDPVATGELIHGGNGGMATWADLKVQASTLLGIQLVDANVGNVPLLATDPYGAFLRGPNGFPQIVTATGLVEGDPTANGGLGILVPENAILTGHAFLADIAHNAVPEGLADGDIEIGLDNPGNEPGIYDNELLDAHYVAGDGRANENIGLTAVHHVFHSEHNRLVEHTKAVILATGDAAFIAEWQLPDGSWNGERLFQAAKFGTEMQYQHLVFEEFARKIQPNINVFLVPDGYDVTIDPSIVAEFAHVVYRFGHSMLTETIDRFDPSFNANHIGLIEGFLNPLQFENNGTTSTVDAGISAGAIIRGMTRQVGNEIDEFVTSALRNNLLGLPLDLATINLARGRDTGVPSLNEARRQFYEATNEDSLLKPYESWVDFAGHLKHEASIINFIASYGTHSLITGQSTIEGKRDAALTIISGVSVGSLGVPADAEDFLNGTGAYASTLGGLENVDLWIGGLAEAIMPFGGMLGSTFNFVFEMQMEKLQSGDRFYYLQRLDGLHLFGEMENNSFAAMIARNTDATHLPSDVFSTPGLILEVDKSRQYNPDTGVFFAGPDGVVGDDPTTLLVDESLDDIMDTNADPAGGGILTPLIIRNNPGTVGLDTNYLRYTGGDHVVLGGTDPGNESNPSGEDILIAGIGDDTLYGDGGDDQLEGGFGNDIINAGEGDDIIKDMGGDDNIKAGAGHDVVHAGPGLDLVMGNDGQDFIFLGTDMGSEVFAGTGNDFIYGNKNAERILGNEGNDWIETGTFDGAPGDNFDEIFAHDGIDGHDVFLGDGGFDEFIGEGGDDIMVGSPGRGKMVGMSGFDWATYKDNAIGVNADLSIPIIFDEAPTLPQNASLDEFESMEGLSGTAFDDILAGTNDVAADRASLANGGTTGFLGSELDADGIALVTGLQAVLGAGVTSFTEGDVLLGGDGSDVITGRMGDDIIDGDKWLDVNIAVMSNVGPNGGTGTVLSVHKSMTTLATQMFSGAINPGQLQIVREIKTANGTGDIDVAVFSDIRANYTITSNPNGTVTVAHTIVSDGLESDGTDTLSNIERLRFSDVEIGVNVAATGTAVISDLTPTEGQNLTVNTSTIADGNGLGAFSYQWQASADGTTWANIVGATGATFTPDNNPLTSFGDQAGLQLRLQITFTDGGGNVETITSAPTGPVGVDWDGIPLVNNTLNGTSGDDIADGVSPIFGVGGNDTLNGNAGDDDLDGSGGNDLITGGAGNDIVTGSGGTDTAVFTGALANFSFATGTANTNIVVTDLTGAEGADTLSSIETLRFNGVNYTVVNGTQGINNPLNGGGGSQAVFGFNGNDVLNGQGGNDIVHGGDGNDILVQGGAAGRDTIDGGAGVDTYQLNGTGAAEVFRIYTRAAALAAGLTGLGLSAEIIVTRNTDGVAGPVTNANVIAELDNIEEIRVNTLLTTVDNGNNPTLPDGGVNGGDDILVIGDFTGTSLLFSTITIDGNAGDDTIDISSLASDHRIVFRSNGGNDILIGNLRPQDVIELPLGSVPGDYEVTENEDGTTTLSNANNSITYSGDGAPEVRVATADTEEPGGEVDEGAAAAPQVGTPNSDVLMGTTGDDNMVAFAGDDVAMGDAGADAISAGEGGDFVSGGSGRDVIFAGAGDDQVFAGADADIVYGDAGADRIFGDQGNDLITAGAGDDTVFGGAGDDLLVAEVGDGNDVYFGDEGGGGTGIDTLDMSAVTANVTVNLGSGPLSNGTASSAQTGNDTLWSIENVNTGSGADTIVASNAVNVMNGGAGNDTFKFTSTSAANGDTIVGFEPGDRLDLSGIDANLGASGDQGFDFTLVTGAAFTAAGQLAVSFESREDGDFTVVEGNVGGTLEADFKIEIAGHQNLNAGNVGL